MKYHDNSEKNQEIEKLIEREDLNPSVVSCLVDESMQLGFVKEGGFFVHNSFKRRDHTKEGFKERKKKYIDEIKKILFS